MGMESMESSIQPMSPEDVAKQQEYKDGKLITLPDGTTRKVYSVEEEIAARKEFNER